MLSPKQPPDIESLEQLRVQVERLGLVASPDGEKTEAGGILNPRHDARAQRRAAALSALRGGRQHLSRRDAARPQEPKGFCSERLDFALEPQAAYELRAHGGYGCEDPRVTFVPVLDGYLMAYTAFGPDGPRMAVAFSKDAYHGSAWLGPVRRHRDVVGDDKDAAFFPEPVLSPSGRKSLAFYHRPMLHLSSVDGRAAIPMIERMPFEDRESIASPISRWRRC